jgi:glycosyltransferase involved in cell wall biosynthesis
VATEGLRDELAARGFTRLGLWGRGVDVELFRPQDKRQHDAPRPYFLYVGRIAVEKGLPDFLKLDLPGTKFVVGDGPALASLRQQYPDTRFVGAHQGEALARWYADADVFVFPSRTDTFGLVVLEALACGVPVAAYPVRGPLDVIGDAPVGVLDEDLGRAALAAQAIDPAACRAFALQRTWTHCARQFVDNLSPFDPAGEAVVASAA